MIIYPFSFLFLWSVDGRWGCSVAMNAAGNTLPRVCRVPVYLRRDDWLLLYWVASHRFPEWLCQSACPPPTALLAVRGSSGTPRPPRHRARCPSSRSRRRAAAARAGFRSRARCLATPSVSPWADCRLRVLPGGASVQVHRSALTGLFSSRVGGVLSVFPGVRAPQSPPSCGCIGSRCMGRFDEWELPTLKCSTASIFSFHVGVTPRGPGDSSFLITVFCCV